MIQTQNSNETYHVNNNDNIKATEESLEEPNIVTNSRQVNMNQRATFGSDIGNGSKQSNLEQAINTYNKSGTKFSLNDKNVNSS